MTQRRRLWLVKAETKPTLQAMLLSGVGQMAMLTERWWPIQVWKRVHAEAYLPLARGELKSVDDAIAKAVVPVKQFMLAHTLQKDLRLFIELSGIDLEASAGARAKGQPGQDGGRETSARKETTPGPPERVEDLSLLVVFPAFVLSELKLAFQMGFLLYLPFLVIDLAVSAILISMGMFMLPPVLVSLPLKVLVFVLVDGWNLIVGQLVESFQVFT